MTKNPSVKFKHSAVGAHHDAPLPNLRAIFNVIKLGGGAGVEHSAALRNLAERARGGERWVLVHGASDAANRLGDELGHPARTLTSPGGHTSRYTDPRTLDIFRMAVGAVNQQISAELATYGGGAVGLAGPGVIRARRKSALRTVQDGHPVVVRDDYSGKITGVDSPLLLLLCESGLIPVIGPLALGDQGECLNVDGDLAAAAIAAALGAERLVILSNVPGLLRDVADPASLTREIDLQNLDAFESYAQGRMKKKLLAAQTAHAGRVILAGSHGERPLDAALAGGGTHIFASEQVRGGVSP
jgi:acetylglutamate/LysW-gamma-L-alpha-aminoadipate kinase